MKKFLLAHIGFEQPTDEIMAAWGKWFEAIAEITVENVGLHPGKEVTSGGINEIAFDARVTTGYTIIQAREPSVEQNASARWPSPKSEGRYR